MAGLFLMPYLDVLDTFHILVLQTTSFFFTRGYQRSSRVLFDFLNCYEQATCQVINRDKSFYIASKHYAHLHARQISALTRIQRFSLPFMYLGCNLYHGRCKKVYFSYLIGLFPSLILSLLWRFLFFKLSALITAAHGGCGCPSAYCWGSLHALFQRCKFTTTYPN